MIWNISKIISDNYHLLSKESSKEHVIFWFFLIPIVISLGLITLDLRLNPNQLGYIISFVSLIVGFLINVSVILVSIKNWKGVLGTIVEKRIFANICYTILVGILLILIVIAGPWVGSNVYIPYIDYIFEFSIIFNILTFSVFIHFIFMILVVIKGFYSLYK